MTNEYSSSAPRQDFGRSGSSAQGGARGSGGGRRFGGGGGGGRPGGGGRRFGRRRVCMFCVDKMHRVDYKNLELLRRYLADSTKIESSRKSGTCMKHQRVLRRALLRARHLALLPIADAHVKMTGPIAIRQETTPNTEEAESVSAESTEEVASTGTSESSEVGVAEIDATEEESAEDVDATEEESAEDGDTTEEAAVEDVEKE